jgi:galactose mutarotase-like enzyme
MHGNSPLRARRLDRGQHGAAIAAGWHGQAEALRVAEDAAWASREASNSCAAAAPADVAPSVTQKVNATIAPPVTPAQPPSSMPPEAGFVCLEPVSHTVDCTNRPMRADMGLAVLAQGESLRGATRITSAQVHAIK